MFTNISRVIKFAFQDFLRNKGVSVAAIFVLIVTILLVTGLFFFQGITSYLTLQIQNKIDITAYFKEGTLEQDILEVKDEILKISPDIKNIEYISQNQAFQLFSEKHKGDEVLARALQQVGSNPFLPSLNVTTTGDPLQYEQVANTLQTSNFAELIDKVDFSENDYFKVYGRGELHIAILLENMRREGYELQVSQPQVIIKMVDGAKHEPFEEVTLDIPQECAGVVIEKMSKRKGQMIMMKPEQNHTRLIYHMPTRGLLGYRSEFIVDTRGEGILCTEVIGFKPHVGDIEKRDVGSMVSGETGKVLAYSLANLQDRGTLFVGANVEVYEGQVIGNTAKGMDMTVNPIKGKHLTNMRSSNSDIAIQFPPPMELTLERGLEVMAEDEYLEITPQSVRLRKQNLKQK